MAERKRNEPNGPAWRHGRARKQLDAKQAAEILGIKHQYLLNIETEQPKATPGLLLVYRACDLYDLKVSDLLRNNNDGVPDEPPPQPQPAPPPQPRRREKAGKAPRRPTARIAS